MNPSIEKLYALAKKDSRLILGLMSGTSLDGLDLALCRISNNGMKTRAELIEFETIEYNETFKEEVLSVFAKEQVSLKTVCMLNAKIAILHASLIHQVLNKWVIKASEVDLIASHGQTIYHAPQTLTKNSEYPNSTLQIGDGDHLAVLTGIITVSDFRQKHVAAGGEGAPLVLYGDYLLFSDASENRIMLNIGGISNFTLLPSTGDGIVSTDVGPGNTLMNQYMNQYFNQSYDQDGKMAAQGNVNNLLLDVLIQHPFFKKPFPKTTGPEEFNLEFVAHSKRISRTESISHQDTIATLAALTAYGISHAINSLLDKSEQATVYLSGGGLHNPVLIKMLQDQIPSSNIKSTDTLGVLPDAKEAILFALLANETVAGAPIHFPKDTKAPSVCMGKISFPQ